MTTFEQADAAKTDAAKTDAPKKFSPHFKWAFLWDLPYDCNPAKDRYVLERNGLTTIFVGVDGADMAVEVAKELVAEGVDFIEMCGSFGYVGVAKVMAGIDYKVPVGGVQFGAEAVSPIYKLMSKQYR